MFFDAWFETTIATEKSAEKYVKENDYGFSKMSPNYVCKC